MNAALKMPITNVFAKGDYCATFYIGSEQTAVNLIIDSGSSTLVVKEELYQASTDQHLTPTSIAQEVNYGIGGWNGPLVHTSVTVSKGQNITIENAPLALVVNQAQFNTFGKADGMVGFAYHHLNKGFNIQDYLHQQNIAPAQTYPWPFTQKTTPHSDDLKQFKQFLWQYPEHDITPYFTDLALHNLCANKFSFYSKRSAIHINEHCTRDSTTDILQQDPLNQGWLILGGGEEQTDLYQGPFRQIKVEHDVYYNVSLVSVQVGDNAPITAAPLEACHQKSYFSNAIIDTGAGGIVLTADIYQQVITDLLAIKPEFSALLTPFKEFSFQEVGINSDQLNLAHWPDIRFTFVGDNQQHVELVCPASRYWQVNTPSHGKACLRLLSQLPQWPNQSIIGLPLLNNYYVVFDRSVDNTGLIKFAKQQ